MSDPTEADLGRARGVVCDCCRNGDPFWEDGPHEGDHTVPGFPAEATNCWNTCVARVYLGRVTSVAAAIAEGREALRAAARFVVEARGAGACAALDKAIDELDLALAAEEVGRD